MLIFVFFVVMVGLVSYHCLNQQVRIFQEGPCLNLLALNLIAPFEFEMRIKQLGYAVKRAIDYHCKHEGDNYHHSTGSDSNRESWQGVCIHWTGLLD